MHKKQVLQIQGRVNAGDVCIIARSYDQSHININAGDTYTQKYAHYT